MVYGENGQGKTNLLEAIWFLGTLRPLRASRAAELVRLEAERAEVKGTVVEAVTTHLAVRLDGGRREATVDGKRPQSVEGYAEALKLVGFTPDDLDIAKGAPSARRRWLDRAAFTRQGGYLADHRAYARALKSRNRLLKEGAPDGPALEAYDEALVRTGARLLRRRLALLAELTPLAAERWQSVTHSPLALGLTYVSDALTGKAPWPEDEAGLAEVLRVALSRRRRVDRQRGFTTAGPHGDDVRLTLSGRDVRAFASQGQQRAVVLALKIAEIENLRARTGRTPVLLLDDVSSELDPERNAHLLAYLAAFPGQVVLTTTDPALAPVPEGADSLHVRVRAGVLTPEDGPPAGAVK